MSRSVAQVPAALLKQAIVPGSEPGDTVDVLVEHGLVAAVGPAGAVAVPEGTTVHDLSGHLLLPAPVEPHAHLDKAFLAEAVPNPTGDLAWAIAAMESYRHLLDHAHTVTRAERAARLMAANGYVAVRTHADVTVGNGLASVTALAEVRARVADVIDVQVVALAGSPVVGAAGARQRELLAEALDAGADLVGGCPHLEDFTPAGIAAATDVLLGIASEHGVGVDLHTDETLDPGADGLAVLARRVLAGFAHTVTASHCVSLGQHDAATQRATAELVAEADIGVIALPHTNLFLQGRGRTPIPRALTAVEALRAAGVQVAAGADNLQDPFNPVGRADPFETAGLMVLAAHLLPADAWASVSTAAAAVLGRPPGGFMVGDRADLLAVPAATVREAIAFAPTPRLRLRA